MIRVLSREDRHDRLVTAEIEQKEKRVPHWQTAMLGVMASINRDWEEHYTLRLNCKLSRAQMKLTLTPKYRSLKRLQLVVSCAPSLEHCYIFEMLTQHPRTDWDEFANTGSEIVRRWYKLDWDANPSFIIDKVCTALTKSITDHVEDTTKRISEGN